jgi:hypothetical protein
MYTLKSALIIYSTVLYVKLWPHNRTKFPMTKGRHVTYTIMSVFIFIIAMINSSSQVRTLQGGYIKGKNGPVHSRGSRFLDFLDFQFLTVCN